MLCLWRETYACMHDAPGSRSRLRATARRSIWTYGDPASIGRSLLSWSDPERHGARRTRHRGASADACTYGAWELLFKQCMDRRGDRSSIDGSS